MVVVVQLVRTPGCGPGGRVFESRQSPHGKMKFPFFCILFIFGGTFTMEKMIIENRIALLTSRDPIGNARIINKLKRRLRKLESK